MKKIILLILGFATLFVEPFKNKINLARAVDSTSSTNLATSQSREIDPSIFDYKTTFDNLPKWTPDLLPNDAPMGSITQLNYTANAMYKLKVDDSLDILSSFVTKEEINGVDYIINNDQNLVSLKISNQENEDYYYAGFYQHAKPIIYFDKTLSGKQNISFYINICFDKNDITNLKNAFPYLEGELPLVVVNDEYAFLKIVFKKTGWSLMTDNYARFDACVRNPIFTNEASPSLLTKVTIPYLDSIQDIKVFNTIANKYVVDAQNAKPDTELFFRFDESMHDRYYFYLFDICSLSILRKELIVDNSTYYSYHHIDGNQHDEMEAQFVSMKVLFTGTKKEKNIPIIKGLAKPDVAPYLYTPILPREIELNFDSSVGYADGKVRYWYFDEFNTEENVSGEFKILSITFHPYLKDPNTNRYYIDTSTTLTHHYENANIHKYSYNLNNGIRTYYYNMTSYFRKQTDSTYTPNATVPYDSNLFSGWICFGFEFYFDKQRKNPIPNVKNITIKYQCGYDRPNPEPGSNGFYPNGNDPKKNVRVKTMEVVERKVRGIGALDDEGMCLTDNATKRMMTDDDNIKHDYVIYKLRMRGPDPGINTMDALEIRYETAPGELVRMVGNSKGLHVVVDDDGVARVYNSEGGLEEDYGVYEAPDGTLVPGKDENGDGKIDSDEVVNSDTGIKTYAPFEDDSFQWWGQELFDFFNKQKTRIITIIIVVVLVIVAIKVIPNLFRKKKNN